MTDPQPKRHAELTPEQVEAERVRFEADVFERDEDEAELMRFPVGHRWAGQYVNSLTSVRWSGWLSRYRLSVSDAARVREDALEEAMKAQCQFCAGEVEFDGRWHVWRTKNTADITAGCNAHAIRALIDRPTKGGDMSEYHTLERTGPKGKPFVGICTRCGTPDLPGSAIFDECENVRGISVDEALAEIISGEAP